MYPMDDSVQALPVHIPVGRETVEADLVVPRGARGVVLFAHGSGSGRHSPRNRFVAEQLNRQGLATLLLDLLTVEEEHVDAFSARLRFDIGLLAERLILATTWVQRQDSVGALPIGYFGASTGAAAALVAAAEHPADIAAVVSRGGRPDLAGDKLPAVKAPVLLIVGGDDTVVIEMNRGARERLRAPSKLVVVPGAGHLFEESGALEEVARLAGAWFSAYLTNATRQPPHPGL